MTISILGYGMQSPTGLNAPMSIANVLAGISRKITIAKYEDIKFKPITLGMADYIDQEYDHTTRMKKMAEAAFKESVQPLLNHASKGSSIKLYLGVPNNRPGLDNELENILDGLFQSLGFGLNLNLQWEYFKEDHDSGLIAGTKAIEDLQNKATQFAIVGGVDSYHSLETIKWLEKEKLLKCSTNRQGFTPGEAAAFIVLSTGETRFQLQIPEKAKILSIATATVPQDDSVDRIERGEELQSVIQQTLSQLPEDQYIKETFCTLRGLHYEAEEYAFTVPQTGHLFNNPGEYTSPVMNWGDIGAASAPALIAYATEKCLLGLSDAGHQLVFTMSLGGSRSAALIQTVK